ncbi:uncharacterized protein CANTADRAFT_329223 [Suhomyces tanzawaensis NRRL Y-17324]|uniref:Uncharacterized protein n=1 Tax=Suhomyces tanzawaensis NRRL Y-17324 TaxID=984487 RepID=A0A1E4SCI6_9ASCO|nr:uncharacterized protein CANTADRAFT_329223 [Suhomyces tanzawaensis NRRL Y-17324]ODV77178.1 hypothetical protein CANTADRAFT_329223 [Suhomyces tanzawaensis NRRL Y-17324]
MPRAELQQLTQKISWLFPGNGKEKVFGLKENGGYGVLDIDLQLRARRALYIYNTLTDTKHIHYAILRGKLQSITPGSHGWFCFLMGDNYSRTFRVKELCQHGDLTEAEREYLKAWFSLITKRAEVQGFSDMWVSKEVVEDSIQRGCLRLEEFLDSILSWDDQPVTAATFTSLSRPMKESKEKVLILRSWNEHLPDIGKTGWKSFWKRLKTLSFKYPGQGPSTAYNYSTMDPKIIALSMNRHVQHAKQLPLRT